MSTRTHNKLSTAVQYVKGLFQSARGNMERMCERVQDSEYNRVQHFISESPWDARKVMDRVAANAGEMFGTFGRVGLLIDESSHAKKGSGSVGVQRQYSGTAGKIDNCQVAVYAALSADRYYGLIDTELYLPEAWTRDAERCRKAGVPKERLAHRSKRQLALDIIGRQKAAGTRFDWVGADAGYGNDHGFLQALESMGLLFMIDVHSNQYVYQQAPSIGIPPRKGGIGRSRTRYATDAVAVEVRELAARAGASEWQEVSVRSGSKGYLKCRALVRKVYTWDRHSAGCCERLLVVRRTVDGSGTEEIKYSLSNAGETAYGMGELVEMQSQRYFVERAFQEAKQDAGMGDYQVRGWLAWHHHMALVMMAQQFVLGEKLLYREEMPLLSAYDIREIMLNVYPRKGLAQQEIMQQIHKRHEQRRKDMLRRTST